MLIVLLVLFFIVSLVLLYFLYDKDIIEPSIILTAAYTISAVSVLYNINKWGINLALNTFLVLILGLIEFVSISYVVHKLFKRKNKENKELYEESEFENDDNKFIKKATIIIIIYNIIVLALLIYNVLNIALRFGEFSSFSEALTLYKAHTSYSNEAELPNYMTIIMKPIIATAYIYMFFFIKKIVFSNREKKEVLLKFWYYLIPPVTYFLQRIFESNRGSILNFILSALVMFFILFNIKHKWKTVSKGKIILKLGISGVCCLILFYFSASLVGRINTKGIVDYITCYCGGSLECFNLYLQENDSINCIRGEETFYRTIRDLNKTGIINVKLKNNDVFEFRYYDENMIGNVYTSYRRWIHDFGYMGIIILQAILAIIFAVSYNLIKYLKCSNKIKDLMIIIYSYFIYTIFMHPIDSLFYLETFTVATVGVILFICIFYWILTRNKKLFKEIERENMKYYICEGTPDGKYNASSKARIDVETILNELKYEKFFIPTKYEVQKNKFMKWKQLIGYKRNHKIFIEQIKKLEKEDVIVIQYPLINTMTNFGGAIKNAVKKGVKVVILIHDMDSLRFVNMPRLKIEEKSVFENCTYIIAHNGYMKKKIVELGVEESKIIELSIFDYISEPIDFKERKINDPIIIAGNLSKEKAGYLAELKNIKDCNFNLYGKGYEQAEGEENVDYKGAFLPEELLGVLEGSFGLIWDGTSKETCNGVYGEYLKYNNPHKVSLYLTASLPIVIWSKAAMADFVLKNDVGITVDSLDEINKKIKEISNEKYQQMVQNARNISNDLRNGKYLMNAIEKALK